MKQKLLNLKSWLLMMCLLVGVGSAWANEITFTAGTDKSSNTSITKDGIKLTATTFSNDSYYQAYSGTPLKVESTVGNITKIEITCTASGTSNYGPSKFSKASVGSYSYSGKVGTWTGNASTISLSTSAQVRMTKVVVTTASSSAPAYALTFTSNSSGSFSATVDGKSVTSGSKVETGKTVTLTATPKDGYVFNAWNVYKTANQYNYVTVSENNTFTMPSEAVTVDAYFIEGKTIPDAQVSVAAGTYRGAQSVTITNIYEDEYSYYYTLDGTTPAIDEGMNPLGTTQEYIEAINITESCTLSILTTDLTDSKVNAFEYVIEVPYTVTIETPENGTLTVMHGEMPVKSGDAFYKGDKITATATPAEGYKFRNVQFTEATAHTFTASNVKEWTMGDYNVTISATFEAIPTYTVAWSVNGTIVKSEELKEGATVTAPTVEDINGKKFVGWVKTATVESATVPTYETIGKAKEELTYYAVFAAENGGGTVLWVEVTSAPTEGTYAICSDDYFMKALVSSNRLQNGSAPKISDGKLTEAPSEDCIWEISKPDEYYRIKNGTFYAGATGSKNQGALLTDASDDMAKWSISYSDNQFEIINYGRSQATSDTNNKCLRNNSTYGWAAYVSTTGKAPRLFKKSGGASYSDFTTTPLGTEEVTVSTVGWATYYTDNAFVMPEGVEGYIMKDNGSKVVSEKVYEAGDVIPAETPVMLHGDAKKHTLIITNENGTEAVGNLLKGKLVAGTTDGGNEGAKYYKFANGEKGLGWYYGSADNTTGAPFTTGAKKAYLVLNAENMHNAKGFVSIFNDDEETNAITNFAADANNVRVYNLNGQLVKSDAKGIVIINGRKYLKK